MSHFTQEYRDPARMLFLSIVIYLGFFVPELYALPTDAGDILPGDVTADTTSGTIVGLISWGVRLGAYSLMVIAMIGATWFIFSAFGEASTERGGWAKFAGVTLGSLIMVSIVVSLGLVAQEWATGLEELA